MKIAHRSPENGLFECASIFYMIIATKTSVKENIEFLTMASTSMSM